MPTESKAPRALSVEKLGTLLETKLEDELLVLSSMIQAMSKGELPAELWGKLHEAALRDDHLLELAAAYEELCNPRMLRRLSAVQQGEILFHAAEFQHRTLEDPDGARAFLERAVAVDPANSAAFDLLENLLIEAGDGARLCELYVNLAGHQAERAEQIRLLRRAAELAEVFGEEAPRLIAIHERLLKVEPSDPEARRALEALYRGARRWAELVKLLEQAIPKKSEGEGDPAAEGPLRARLIALYLDELQQPERALGHVEELLRVDPGSEAARDGARKLLSHKLLGARAALALENALDRSGELAEQILLLPALIEATRGAQRNDAQRRLALALLRAGRDEEALPALEKSIFTDASAEDLRQALRLVGARLGRLPDVARTLLRCASTTRTPELRQQLNLEAAEIFLEAGEPRKSIPPLQIAAEAEAPEIRIAALRLLPRVVEEPAALVASLEQLIAQEPSEEARLDASVQLAQLLDAQGQLPDAIAAWRRLLPGPRREQAEAALLDLYERSLDIRSLVELLEERSLRSDDDLARASLERAASLRETRLDDGEGALSSWNQLARRFGSSPTILRRRRDLLDKLGRHAELVAELVAESGSGSPEARGELWGIVAQLRLDRLADTEGALAACSSALALVPAEPRASAVAQSLLGRPASRLHAAAALEPIFRDQADFWGLVQVLEILGMEDPDSRRRLLALGEAVELVASDDPPRALRLAREGLALAIRVDVDTVPDWLVRLELLSGAAEGPGAHAAMLLEALGARPLDHPALQDLARRAVASLLEAGRPAEGLALLGRILEVEPARLDLLPSLDRLLQGRGEGAARVALWREALRHERRPEGRADALRTLAGLCKLQGELRDAVAALEELLGLVPGDLDAWRQLLEALRQVGPPGALVRALQQAIPLFEPGQRRALREELAPLLAGQGEPTPAIALLHELIQEAPLPPALLSLAHRLASGADEPLFLRRILEARVAAARDPDERAGALEALGDQLGGAEGAALWIQAGSLLQAKGDPRARALFLRAVEASEDPRAIDALLALARAARSPDEEARWLLRRWPLCDSAEAEVELLLTLLPLGSSAEHVASVERVRGGARFAWSPAQRGRVLVACMAAYGALPGAEPLALDMARSLLQLDPDVVHLDRFEELLARWPAGPLQEEARRWALRWRAEQDPQDAVALRRWAEAEEQAGASAEATALYRRVLALDPGAVGVHERLVELLLQGQDFAAASAALGAWMEQSEGVQRRALALRRVALCIEQTGQLELAVELLEALIAETPGEEAALRWVDRILATTPSPSLRERISGLLEHCLLAEPEPGAALALLERLLQCGGSPEQRRAWLQGVLSRPMSPEDALPVALRAVDEAPLEESFWDLAEQLARQLGQPGGVIEAYKRHLSSSASAAAIGQRAINFYEEWFEEPEGVIALVERVLLADVGARWAFDRLKVFYGADERWGELLSLYDRMITAARDDTDRLVFLEDAVEIARDFAGDDPRAIGYLEHLVALRPDDTLAVASLERLYERNGRWDALIPLLRRQLSTLDPEAAQRQRQRIAGLLLDPVGDLVGAHGILQEMLAISPEDPDALALLTRLLGSFQRPASPLAPDLLAAYLGAARLLTPRFLAPGHERSLLLVLQVELLAASSTEEKARLLARIVELQRGPLADLPGAFDSSLEWLATSPSDLTILASTRDLASLTAQLPRLLGALDLLASSRPRFAPLLLREAARIAASLGHDASARYIAAIQAARSGDDPTLALSSSTELVDLLSASSGREIDLFEALATMFELSPQAQQRKDIAARMALLARGPLADPARLARAWNLLLPLAPDDPDALAGLIEAYQALQDWPNLVLTLRHRAGGSVEPHVARADLWRAVEILDDRMDSPQDALGVWTVLRERFPEDERILPAGAELLTRLGRFDELAALLREQIERTGAPAERSRRLCWLGDVERSHRRLDLPAVEAYVEALRWEPGCKQAVEGLVALTREGGSARAEALAALLAYHEKMGDHRGILSLLELRLELAAEQDTRVLILLEGASLQEYQLQAPREALAQLRRALTLAPADLGIAREVLRVAASVEAYQEGIEALQQAAHRLQQGVEARALWLLCASAQLGRDDDGADRSFEQALALGPDAETLQALVALRRRTQADGLVDALLRLAEATEHDPALLLEAGEVAAQNPFSGDPAGVAWRILAQAAVPGRGWAPWQPAVDWAVGALTEGADQEPSSQADALRQALALGSDDARKVRWLRRLAALCEGPLAQHEEAIDCSRRILALLPGDQLALRSLTSLFRRLERRPELIAALRSLVEVTSSAEERGDLRLELAALLRDASQLPAAIAVLQEALAESPDQDRLAAALAELYESDCRFPAWASLLEERAARLAPSQPAEAAALWARAALLAEDPLQDLPRAVIDHRQAVSLGLTSSLDPLARLLLSLGAHAEAADVLRQIASHSQGPERADALARLADALSAEGRPAEARQALEQALLDATDPAPLQRRLMTLCRADGDWGRLAELLVLDARRAPDPRTRAMRLREAAEMLLEHRLNFPFAAALLQEASDLVPEDPALLLLLGESLRLAGSLEPSCLALRKLIELYGARRPKERALAHFQIALSLHDAGDADLAFAELDLASRIDPAHPRILFLLGRFAIQRNELERAQKALRSLLLLLPRGARSEHGVSRVEVQLSLADIARKQGDSARADELIESALTHAREHEDDWDQLDRYLREARLLPALARSLELRLSLASPPRQAPLLQELASLYLHDLEQPTASFERGLRALRLRPADGDLRALVLAAAKASGEQASLRVELANLAGRLESEGHSAAVEVWFDAAQLLEDPVSIRQALECAERCATGALAPSWLPRIWSALDDLLTRVGDRALLREALLRRRSLSDFPGADPAEPLYRLAELALEAAPPLDEGLAALEEALRLDPRVERAAVALRRAAQLHAEEAPLLRMYERFSREQGLHEDRVEALRLLGALPGAGTAPWREAAELTIARGQDTIADAILRELSGLDQSPSSLPDVIWALSTLAERVLRRGDTSLAAALKERAAEIAPVEQRTGRLLEVATLVQGSLKDTQRAIKIYETILAESPSEARAWGPLAELLRASGDEPRLIALLERLLLLTEGASREQFRAELIDVLLRDSQAEEGVPRAIALLQEALAERPRDLALSRRLAELLERTGAHAPLAALLETQLEDARDQGDGPTAAALALRLGALLESLGERARAAEIYRVGLRMAPEHVPLLRALLRLVDSDEDSSELAELSLRLLRLIQGPEVVPLAMRLASLHESNWNPEAAEQALALGYEAFPSPVLRDLLVERYTEDCSWSRLAALLTHDAAHQPSPAARAEALRKAAEVHSTRLSDPQAAADLLQQAFSLDPSNLPLLTSLLDALRAIATPGAYRRAVDVLSFAIEQRPGDPELLRLRAELHTLAGAFDEALRDLDALAARQPQIAAPLLRSTLHDALRSSRHPPTLRPWRLRLASLLSSDGRLDDARSLLEAAVRDEPTLPEPLLALVALERASRRWEAMIAPLLSLASSASGSNLTSIAIDLSEAAQRAARPAEARATLERALRETPEHGPLRAALRAVYEQVGAKRELARMYCEEASVLKEPGPRFEALLAAARLLLDPAHGDLKLAAQILEDARSLRPDDLELASLLAETHVNARRPREALQVIERAVTAHRGRRSRPLGQLFQRKAQIELRLGERAAALQSLGKAFDNDASNGTLAMELGLLALELNNEAAATRAFRAISLMKVSASGEDGTTSAAKAQAYYQLALLALGQADPRKARLLVEKAVAEDPTLEVARRLRDELVRGG
jgi:tetratricopeptide (TPR) repeat protein